jgi:pyrroloquinoline quinone biosynthesis protein E
MNMIPKSTPAPPLALLAEPTHRCPLQCPYCSNPVELERGKHELDTYEWQRIIDEAAALDILQIHFSGGEPTARRDLVDLVAHARAAGLYTNLITAGVLLDAGKLRALKDAGLDHVQLSFQDSEAAGADRIGGYKGGHEKKLVVARLIREAGFPLTLNLVVHRQNLHHLDALLAMAVELDAHRVEIAHVQYYGWALKNRAALMPTRAQLEHATKTVEDARIRLKGQLVIDYVVPDYYAKRPKACMGGWGRQFLNVSPAGKVLPCHAAEAITTLQFDSARQRSLGDIWLSSDAFNRFRGTDWMPEPCRSCDRREIDWGGCRCQAFAILGDAAATDPACGLSSFHENLVGIAERDSAAQTPDFIYRRIGIAKAKITSE